MCEEARERLILERLTRAPKTYRKSHVQVTFTLDNFYPWCRARQRCFRPRFVTLRRSNHLRQPDLGCRSTESLRCRSHRNTVQLNCTAIDDMKHSRVPPDALTYSILISGFLQNGDLRYSMEWYYKMMHGGFVPATFLVNNLMAALHGSGQGQQVVMLFRDMERHGVRKNEQSFEIAMEACEKFGLEDARAQIENEFKDYLAVH